MKDTIIPQGYRLTVVSWENDADAYNTQVAEGLSKERTAFLIEAVELCRGKLGNLYDPDPQEIHDFRKAAVDLYHRFPNEYPGDNLEDIDDPEISGDCLHEELYDLMGASECYFTRVLESWNVEYVPEQIVLHNANHEFRKPGSRGY